MQRSGPLTQTEQYSIVHVLENSPFLSTKFPY